MSETKKQRIGKWLDLKAKEKAQDNPTYQEWLDKYQDRPSQIYYVEAGINEMPMSLLCKYIKEYRKDKLKKHYYYLITFSKSPECSKEDDELELFIISQAKRPALHIVDASYTKEYTKNGVAHWHLSVKSSKYIAKNRFNYYVKNFGFVDVSSSTVNSRDESLNYINKDSVSTDIILNSVCVL